MSSSEYVDYSIFIERRRLVCADVCLRCNVDFASMTTSEHTTSGRFRVEPMMNDDVEGAVSNGAEKESTRSFMMRILNRGKRSANATATDATATKAIRDEDGDDDKRDSYLENDQGGVGGGDDDDEDSDSDEFEERVEFLNPNKHYKIQYTNKNGNVSVETESSASQPQPRSSSSSSTASLSYENDSSSGGGRSDRNNMSGVVYHSLSRPTTSSETSAATTTTAASALCSMKSPECMAVRKVYAKILIVLFGSVTVMMLTLFKSFQSSLNPDADELTNDLMKNITNILNESLLHDASTV